MAIVDRRGAVLSMTGGASAGAPDTDNAIKAPVRVATVGQDIVLAGLQAVDGVTLGAGDRVLVKDQDDPKQNGIYSADTGAWSRAVDAAAAVNFAQGMLVDVAQGFVNAGALYELISPAAPIEPGTSPLVFASAAEPMALQAVFDGGGQPISTGLKLHAEIASRFTLRRWTVLADRPGNFAVDLWRAPFSSLPLQAGNSITGGAPPTLVDAQFAQSSDLSGWQTGLNAGDVVGFNIVSVDVLQRITLSLWGSRP